ncbi:MAG: hypothetical protein ACM3S2_12000 [Ignavibacteriales bacterium]
MINNRSKVVITVLLLLSGCMTVPLSRQSEEAPAASTMLYSMLPGNFSNLWQQRTVKLSVTVDQQAPAPIIGGSSGEGEGGRSRMLPIDLSVTYMDSVLVKAGLTEFETLAQMNPQESAEFENRYHEKFQNGNFNLIWMEMNSFYSEDALTRDKWTIYLEDDRGNKYEPSRILENPATVEQNPILSDSGAQNNEPGRFNRAEMFRLNSKSFLLYFPQKGYDGKDIIRNTKALKFVFFEWSSRDVKKEGTLNLSVLKSGKPAGKI